MKEIIGLALALAIGGCASAPDQQASVNLAWKACAGVEPWQVHSACLREQYRLQETQNQAAGSNAATVLMLLGAGLSGYNQGRALDQFHMPVSTSCTTTSTGVVNCLSY